MKSNPGVAATMFETLAADGHQHRDDLHLGHPHLLRRRARPRSSRPSRPSTPPSSLADGPVFCATDPRTPCAAWTSTEADGSPWEGRGRRRSLCAYAHRNRSAPPVRSAASCCTILAERAVPRRRAPPLRLGPLGRAARLPWRRRRDRRSRTPRPPTTSGLDIALFSAGAPPPGRSPRGSPAAGAIVIDNSSAWRMDPDVPLVVPEVNAHALDSHPQGHRRQPELHDHGRDAGAQAARPRGRPARDGREHLPGRVRRRAWPASAELDEQVRKVGDGAAALDLSTAPRSTSRPPTKFPTTIAFNVIPLAGTLRRRRARARPTRSRSSATRAARSSSSPTCSCPATLRAGAGLHRPLAVDQRRGSSEPLSPRAGPPRSSPGADGVELADVPTPLEAAGGDPTHRRPHPPRPHRPDGRPRPVRLRRQPPQGRRPQRGPDRRSAPRPPLAPAGWCPLASASSAGGRGPRRTSGSRPRSGRPRPRARGRAARPATPTRPARRPARGAAAPAVPLRTAWASSPSSSVSQATVAGTPRARSCSP